MEKRLLNIFITGIIALGLTLTPLTSQAWGALGHRAIVLIAQSQLTPAAQLAIDRLLALEPGSSLTSIASWADEYRDSSTTRWHFVNFPRGDCRYQPQRDCPNGQC